MDTWWHCQEVWPFTWRPGGAWRGTAIGPTVHHRPHIWHINWHFGAYHSITKYFHFLIRLWTTTHAVQKSYFEWWDVLCALVASDGSTQSRSPPIDLQTDRRGRQRKGPIIVYLHLYPLLLIPTWTLVIRTDIKYGSTTHFPGFLKWQIRCWTMFDMCRSCLSIKM